MSESAIRFVQHSHVVLVLIFLIFVIIKSFLLFIDSPSFDGFRKKTMLSEIIITTLFTVLGFILLFRIGFANIGGWFHLKLTLVVAAVALAIIGFRKKNKLMVLIADLIFLYILLLALSKNVSLKEVDFSRLWT